MSIRNLDHLFEPTSIAVFGASERAGSIGAIVWANLRAAGFQGQLHAVNPRHRRFQDGVAVYRSLAELPAAPELAIVCTPAPAVAGLIAELGTRGTRAAVVLSPGMDREQSLAMCEAARPFLLRILGPDSIGLLSPHRRLNASFAHTTAAPGELAFVSQSSALASAMLDWARTRAIGFSHFVSLGDQVDVDFGDMLDYLASDPRTRAILLYAESISQSRKFMSAARAAARNKPVIIVKAGRSQHGGKAAASHTGALVGSDLVHDAAIARAGMLRVDTLQELFLAAETLSRLRASTAEQLTILTNGGGSGVMAADAAERAGIALASLGEATRLALARVLPAGRAVDNPLDIGADAPVQRYVAAIEALQADPDAGALLFIQAPTACVSSTAIAQAIVPVMQARSGRWLGCWLGAASVAPARQAFQGARIASFETPQDAVNAFSMLVRYRRNQAQLREAPTATPGQMQALAPDTGLARQTIEQALAQGRQWLSEPEAKTVLAAYRIPVANARITAGTPQAAVEAAESIGYPVVLKIVSDDLAHKSDVGGVALDLGSPAAVRQAAQHMLGRIAQQCPQARLQGFSVQAMVRISHGRELIVGASIDPVFGPVILFGAGGTSADVVADRAIALPPLNPPLASALVRSTRVARLLEAYRDTPAAAMDALLDVLVAVSGMLAELPELVEVDINPLLAGPAGVIALDARIRVSTSAPGGADSFAIRPYPAQLIETVPWQNQTLVLRPIRPGDEAQHLEFLARIDPQDIRMRIFYSRRTIEPSELARLTQIDYAREISFVAVRTGPDGREETLGTVRAISDPDNVEAEFGIIVRSDLKGTGLGAVLMDKLIRTLRAGGTRRLVATVLKENVRMLALQRRLGFVDRGADASDGTCEIALDLQHGPADPIGTTTTTT